MDLTNVFIVLVRTRNSHNIGSTARAMRNFGLSRLRLVDTVPLDENAYKMGVMADEILDQSEWFSTVAEAVSDLHVVAGSTRRSNRRLFGTYRTPSEFSAELLDYAEGTKVGLLFGNERNGLSNPELRYCERYVTIPAQEPHASLNLSHAVAIVTAALFEAVHGNQPVHEAGRKDTPVERREIIELEESLAAIAGRLGLFVRYGEESYRNFLAHVLQRSSLPRNELRLVLGFIHKVELALRRAYGVDP
ncbi:MAG: hypothetical protein A2284_13220 [Deltaproteobacteria bacterium RIFOXYA12_FULL_61_11]|nr:MAG: hypothetical protein A2284_13220 [Deltaproteobacteria bacterium RIFOXYA12_FULL_61_11]